MSHQREERVVSTNQYADNCRRYGGGPSSPAVAISPPIGRQDIGVREDAQHVFGCPALLEFMPFSGVVFEH
jgi:hypothetical protein